MRRLPDAEFEIMKVVWNSTPPVTTATIMERLGTEKGWKAPTIISLMLRLVEHGFLRTEKKSRERTYWPTVEREDYLRFETGYFMKLYHENSLAGLVNTLDGAEKISEVELDRLQKWLDSKKGEMENEK